MLGRKDQRLSRLLMTGLLIACAPADASQDKESTPGLLLGGSFERMPVQRFLPGSKRTVLFPARMGRHGEITPLQGDSALTEASWDRFLKESGERAGLLLATMDPRMIRDARGVIQMAVISRDDPMTASCILAPGFLQRFSAIFGPELIVAIPARNKIYIFPKLANRLPDISRTITDDYLISPMPISTELFEISRKGIRAVGDIDPNG
jgi:hypothetical protein